MEFADIVFQYFTGLEGVLPWAFVQFAVPAKVTCLAKAEKKKGECAALPKMLFYLSLVVGHGESKVAADALACDGLSHGSG